MCKSYCYILRPNAYLMNKSGNYKPEPQNHSSVGIEHLCSKQEFFGLVPNAGTHVSHLSLM